MDLGRLPPRTRRARATVIVGLAVLLVGIVAAGVVAYHPAPDTPRTPQLYAPEDGPAGGANTSFVVRARLRGTVAGETSTVAVDIASNATTGIARRTTVIDGTAVTSYRTPAHTYERIAYASTADYERRLRQLRNDSSGGQELVRADAATDTLYLREPGGTDADDLPIEAGIVLSTVDIFPYERRGPAAGTNGDLVEYRPQPGWHRYVVRGPGNQTVYVRSASGRVLVDATTGRIHAVDVAGTVVTDVDVWPMAYVAPADDILRISISYTFTSGPTPVDEPPWVTTMREEPANASTG